MARAVARVLLEISLVVVLGRPETGSGDDLGHDRPVEVVLCLSGRLTRRLLLRGVVEKDRRAVLVTVVGALAVQGRRVVHVPEGIQQLVVRDLCRVVSDLDRLSVTGPARADLLVGRVVPVAARITRNGIDDAGDLVEEVLDPPKASARESCLFHAGAQRSVWPILIAPSRAIRRTYDAPRHVAPSRGTATLNP